MPSQKKTLIFQSGKKKIEGEPKHVILLTVILYSFITLNLVLVGHLANEYGPAFLRFAKAICAK